MQVAKECTEPTKQGSAKASENALSWEQALNKHLRGRASITPKDEIDAAEALVDLKKPFENAK
jgi:hypothetical protein